MKKRKNKIDLSRLSDNTKNRIKTKFESINPDKLGKVQRAYYNKVKAGKQRYATSYKTEDGKLTQYKPEFIKKVIEPALKNLGREINKHNISEYLKDPETKRIAETLFRESVVTWHYNPQTFDKMIKNFTGKLYINDGDGEFKVSKAKLKEQITLINTALKDAGAYSFFSKVQFKEGFTKGIVNLPNLDSLIDMLNEFEGDPAELIEYLKDEFEGFNIVVSGGKKK